MVTSFSKCQHEQVLKDWLSEFKSLPETSLAAYAKLAHEKDAVLVSFKSAVNSFQNESLVELVQPASHQLFEFYRSGNNDLKIHAISFFPALVGGYLLACSSKHENASKIKVSLGTCLLAIYNLVCEENEKENSDQNYEIEMPNLSNPSIYHDPMAYPFSEYTVNSSNHGRTFVKLPPMKSYLNIYPENRSEIMDVIMSCYADYVAIIPTTSLIQVCDMCLQIVSQAFPWHSNFLKVERTNDIRRVQITSSVMLSILRSVYFALYNGCRSYAISAIEAAKMRGCYEMCPKVQLFCNAVLNSTLQEDDQNLGNSPLGLPTLLTPILSRSSSSVSRHAVTAKSIKDHKWKHTSEEVSGDFTTSLHQDDDRLSTKDSTERPTTELDSTSKSDKHSVSPSKLLKSKLKKNLPNPSGEKSTKSSASISTSEKKSKKYQLPSPDDDEVRTRSPSGNSVEFRDLPNRSGSNRFSSASVPSLKQLSIEDSPDVKIEDGRVPKSESVHDGPQLKVTTDTKNLSPNPSHDTDSPKVTTKKSKGKMLRKSSKDSDSKDFFSHLKRSGSKKGAEAKLSNPDIVVTRVPESLPLLYSNEANDLNDYDAKSLTTEM
uniref:Hyccin n=1 Tax=Ciona savignyi TaxID=51511 RepID=H2Z869_CIOSA